MNNISIPHSTVSIPETLSYQQHIGHNRPSEDSHEASDEGLPSGEDSHKASYEGYLHMQLHLKASYECLPSGEASCEASDAALCIIILD